MSTIVSICTCQEYKSIGVVAVGIYRVVEAGIHRVVVGVHARSTRVQEYRSICCGVVCYVYSNGTYCLTTVPTRVVVAGALAEVSYCE